MLFGIPIGVIIAGVKQAGKLWWAGLNKNESSGTTLVFFDQDRIWSDFRVPPKSNLLQVEVEKSNFNNFNIYIYLYLILTSLLPWNCLKNEVAFWTLAKEDWNFQKFHPKLQNYTNFEFKGAIKIYNFVWFHGSAFSGEGKKIQTDSNHFETAEAQNYFGKNPLNNIFYEILRFSNKIIYFRRNCAQCGYFCSREHNEWWRRRRTGATTATTTTSASTTTTITITMTTTT